MRFKVLKYENMKNDFSDNEDIYSNKDSENQINDKKISTSYIKRIKKKLYDY